MCLNALKELKRVKSLVPLNKAHQALKPLSNRIMADDSAVANTDNDIPEKSFTFHSLGETGLSALNERDAKALFEKWGLLNHTALMRFRYDELARKYDLPKFLVEFFSSQEVRSVLKTLNRRGAWSHVSAGKTEKVVFEELNCSQTSMTFFDRLQPHVVRPTGHIMKCMEEEYDGVLCPDELHQLFVNEDSEHYCLYNDSERSELLFHILRVLVLGGGVNQYEDTIEPYFNMAKQIYKDLVSVQKVPQTGKLEVVSWPVKVIDVEGLALFPFEHTANFCYITVDPVKRHVILWYGGFIPPW